MWRIKCSLSWIRFSTYELENAGSWLPMYSYLQWCKIFSRKAKCSPFFLSAVFALTHSARCWRFKHTGCHYFCSRTVCVFYFWSWRWGFPSYPRAQVPNAPIHSQCSNLQGKMFTPQWVAVLQTRSGNAECQPQQLNYRNGMKVCIW